MLRGARLHLLECWDSRAEAEVGSALDEITACMNDEEAYATIVAPLCGHNFCREKLGVDLSRRGFWVDARPNEEDEIYVGWPGLFTPEEP